MSDAKSPGEQAYDAYGKTTDYKNYQGLPMPAWENLTDKIREAWENAANKVAAPIVLDPIWASSFDERQQSQIRFAILYARDFHHGADSHNNMMIIAKLVELLDASV